MWEYVIKYLDELEWLLFEMSPWLLLGFLIAGVLHVFFPEEKTNRYFGKRSFGSVLRATLLGIPLPLCSCGVIPAGISIYKNGASKGASLSFMISTPQTGVDSIMLTYSMLGLPFAIIRPVVAFFTGILGGVLGNAFLKDEQKIPVKKMEDNKVEKIEGNPVVRMMRYAFITLVQDIAKWLFLGILLAALISVLVPNDFFSEVIESNILGMLTLLAVSIPLYVCATGSIPIAAVLIMKGFSPGAALVFLMAGPATNIATMSVIGNAMGKKTLLVYMITIVAGALLSGMLVDGLFPAEWFKIIEHSHDHQHMLPEWLRISSGILMSLLILLALFRKYLLKFFSSASKPADESILAVKVKGMNCKKCCANVQTHLVNLEGIESVEVDLEQEVAFIKGNNPDIDLIKQTVESLGYKFGGII